MSQTIGEIYKPGLEHGEVRHPQRPLGYLSDFVVESLPKHLTHVRSGSLSVGRLSDTAGELVDGLQDGTVMRLLLQKDRHGFGAYPYARERDLAGFDLKVLEAAIVHSGGEAPKNLVSLVNEFAKASNLLPAVTYEELIYINPYHDMRTFTQGETGKSEQGFYLGHRQIETEFEKVVGAIRYATGLLMEQGVGAGAEVARVCAQTDTAYDAALAAMDTFRTALPKDHFAEFRGYFLPHPKRGIFGPSGLYSSALPTLDLLLAGETLTDKHLSEIGENMEYYPRHGRVEITLAKKNADAGNSLVALLKRNSLPEEVIDIAQSLSAKIREFRGRHYATVRHHIPQALQQEATLPGSGGVYNPGKFLRGRLQVRHGFNGGV